MYVENSLTLNSRLYPTTKFQSSLYSTSISDSGDIENNELIKNDLIKQLDKHKVERLTSEK